MGGIYCAVYGCLNSQKQNPELSFFRVPKVKERRITWLKLIGREDIEAKSPRVCSKHFEQNMIVVKALAIKPDAKPTLYLPPPDDHLGSSTSVQPVETEVASVQSSVYTKTKVLKPIITEDSKETVFVDDSNISLKRETAITCKCSIPKVTVSVQTTLTTFVHKAPERKYFVLSRNKKKVTKTKSIQIQIPCKRKLMNDLCETESKQRKLQTAILKLKFKETEKNAMINSQFVLENEQNSNDILVNVKSKYLKGNSEMDTDFKEDFLEKFIKWQRQLKRKFKGNRYTKEMKFFALNIYFSSPLAYECLRKKNALPCLKTLQKLKLIFEPGVSEQLVQMLGKRFNQNSSNYKYCILCLDEMVLRKSLYYDIRNDEIIGVHNIDGEKSPELASNAFVIMLRGCIENYKQPLGYAFTATTEHYTQLANWLNKTIKLLLNAGMEVCAIVSDQRPNFINLAKSKGVTVDKPYFMLEGKKIFYLFDVPHLVKSIRNNLMTNKFLFNETKSASWEYVKSFYNKEKEKPLKLAPKLTDAHINPNQFQHMKVCYATQVLSYTVAAGMSLYIDGNLLPVEAKDTVDFLLKVNNTFDVLNSSKLYDANKYKKAFTGADYQLECLTDSLKMFSDIKAIDPLTGENKTNMIKAFSGLQATINGILQLFEYFQSEGLKYIFTRRLNQDALGNFFGSVRQQGGNTGEPTPIQFQRAFSKLVLGNLIKQSSIGNCEEDLDDFLLNHDDCKTFVNQRKTEEFEPLLVQTSDYRIDLPARNELYYLSGYLLKKCSLKHECPAFSNYKHHQDVNESLLFIKHKSYGNLIMPPNNFVQYIEKLEDQFLKKIDQLALYHGTGNKLLQIIKTTRWDPPCTCFPLNYLQSLFIRMRIFYALKYTNRDLKRKTVKMRSFINLKHM